MFIRESKSKRNGKVHRTFQIAESYRDDSGKVKQRTLLHLGPANKFLKKDINSLINGLLKAKGKTLEQLESEADNVKSFGQIFAVLHLWKELKISQTVMRLQKQTNIKFCIKDHLKCLVLNRLDDPSSKLRLMTWLETVYIPGINKSEIHYEYLLRAMDFIIERKEEIEKAISNQMLNLFNSELKLCFYDLTSTYFEAEASITDDDIRRNGYSRDKRPDRKQIVIGVVMTSDGMPLAHYTFQGNTSDRSTLKEVTDNIKKRFGIKKLLIVCDKGLVSGSNLEYLNNNKTEFILGESPKQSIVAREVIQQANKDRIANSKKDQAYIYETQKVKKSKIIEIVGDKKKTRQYETELRYIAAYNPAVAKKKRLGREQRIKDTMEEIKEILAKNINPEDHYHQIKSCIERKRISKLIKADYKKGKINIINNDEAILQAKVSDGWFLTITSNKELDKEAIISSYKDLKHVEHGFYELKHSLDLRPNFHWTEKRIQGHVMICFISLQIAALLERRLEPIKLSWEKAIQKLSCQKVIEWKSEKGSRKALTKTKPEQLEIFSMIGSRKPTINSL